MTFFKKWDPRQRVYLPNGNWLQFEDLKNGFGVLATDDGYLLGQLRECVKRQAGGVEEITQAEYEEVKKKEPMNLLGKNWQEVLDLRKISVLFRKLAAGVVDDERRNPFQEAFKYAAREIAPPVGRTGYRPRAVAR